MAFAQALCLAAFNSLQSEPNGGVRKERWSEAVKLVAIRECYNKSGEKSRDLSAGGLLGCVRFVIS